LVLPLYRKEIKGSGDEPPEKRRLELELESLVVPEVNAAEEAGNLLQDLPHLWEQASKAERRSLLQARLESVYVDHKDAKAIVAIQPKPAFRAVFQVATINADSGVILIKEPPDQPQKAPSPCSWWRRGRVELPVIRPVPHRSSAVSPRLWGLRP